MQRVYNYMAGGIALTGIVAWVVANTSLGDLIFGTPLRWVAVLLPFVFFMILNFKLMTMSLPALRALFWAFCATMGLSLAVFFIIFTQASIARAFFITAATFGTMSLWGYTTKRDLSAFGAFLMMGVIGIFIAMMVNIFLKSAPLQWAVSVVGVVVFTGLAAWDTQRIKQTYAASWGTETNEKLAVAGALQLYLSFINAFRFILELTGTYRSR
jgi:FtsH-binding integral membrane protein